MRHWRETTLSLNVRKVCIVILNINYVYITRQRGTLHSNFKLLRLIAMRHGMERGRVRTEIKTLTIHGTTKHVFPRIYFYNDLVSIRNLLFSCSGTQFRQNKKTITTLDFKFYCCARAEI